jgi:hypothetical protein
MKPMQKKLVGLVVACGAIATSAMVFGKAVEVAPVSMQDRVVTTPNDVHNGTAIAISENDIYVVHGGEIIQLDRDSLVIKKKASLNTQASSTVVPSPINGLVQPKVE